MTNEMLAAYLYTKNERMRGEEAVMLSFYAYSWGLVLLNQKKPTENEVLTSEKKLPVIVTKLFDGNFFASASTVWDTDFVKHCLCLEEGVRMLKQPSDKVLRELNEFKKENDSVMELLDQVLVTFSDFDIHDLYQQVTNEPFYVKSREGLHEFEANTLQLDDMELYDHFEDYLTSYVNSSFLVHDVTTSFQKQVGSILRTLRTLNDQSVETCAAVIGLTPRDYLRLERGTHDLGLDSYQKLLKHFKYKLTLEVSIEE